MARRKGRSWRPPEFIREAEARPAYNCSKKGAMAMLIVIGVIAALLVLVAIFKGV